MIVYEDGETELQDLFQSTRNRKFLLPHFMENRTIRAWLRLKLQVVGAWHGDGPPGHTIDPLAGGGPTSIDVAWHGVAAKIVPVHVHVGDDWSRHGHCTSWQACVEKG